jgi:nitrogen fixation/metabolism regulation signal transduction histidine kinase
MTAKDRRRRLRIVHKLQLKYTWSLLLPFFIIFLIVELQMFYVIKYLLPYIEFLAVRGVIVKSIVIIMIEVLILLALAGMFNIIYLHRIAGPISRLIKEIDEMVANKKYHLLTIRKKDELFSLIQKFNLIIEELIRKTEI